jgi:CRP-like cAMP-binding protein
MENKIYENLHRLSLSGQFPKAVLTAIESVAVRRTYIPDAHVILEGGACNSAYFIVKGEVKVYRTSSDGRNQVLARLGPGHWFNFVPCLTSAKSNPATVSALTPVKALVISDIDLRQLIHNHHDLALAVLYDLADRMQRLTGMVESLGLLHTRGRVARFLLKHADEDGYIHWEYTHEEIAEWLGTVPDMVGRALRGFVDEALIDMTNRRYIVILDIARLKTEALR